MLTTLRERLTLGLIAAIWTGGGIVVVPDRGWAVLAVFPVLFGLVFAGVTRSWMAVGLLPVAYGLAAWTAGRLFPPEDPLRVNEVLLAGAAFAAGLAITTVIIHIRERVNRTP